MWVRLKYERERTNESVLEDIDSQLLSDHIYRDSDKVTWGHETTHGINSRIRQEFNIENGYYMLYGNAFIIKSPDLTLKVIADNIPNNIKGGIFNLYLVNSRQWWNNPQNYTTPLYIIDECISYFNGSLVGEDEKLYDRAIDSFGRCLEMFEYVLVLKDLAIDFVDFDELSKLIDEIRSSILSFARRNKDRLSSNNNARLARIKDSFTII